MMRKLMRVKAFALASIMAFGIVASFGLAINFNTVEATTASWREFEVGRVEFLSIVSTISVNPGPRARSYTGESFFNTYAGTHFGFWQITGTTVSGQDITGSVQSGERGTMTIDIRNLEIDGVRIRDGATQQSANTTNTTANNNTINNQNNTSSNTTSQNNNTASVNTNTGTNTTNQTAQQATATPSGTHLGYVLNTNIRVFIDDVQIMGYNIDGWTYVVAEDLIAYGFVVVWNVGEQTLSITKGQSTASPQTIPPNTAPSGSIAFSYVSTNIRTFIYNKQVTSHNINGSTVVRIDDVAEIAGLGIDWDVGSSLLALASKSGRDESDHQAKSNNQKSIIINGFQNNQDRLSVLGRLYTNEELMKWIEAAPSHIETRSAEVLPNRRLSQFEVDAWIDEYWRLGGMNAAELEIVMIINEIRAEYGLHPLMINNVLSMSSRFHSQEMADLGYFSHVSPNTGGPAGRVEMLVGHLGYDNYGNRIFLTGGENVGTRGGGSDTQARRHVERWMNSPGHRATILTPYDVSIGVGVVNFGGATMKTGTQ